MKYSVFSAALLACAAAVVTGAPIFDNSVSNSKLTSTAVSGSGSGKSGNDVIVANSIGSTEIGTDAVDNDAIVADSVQGSGTGHTSALYDVIKAASIGTADIDATLKDDNIAADANIAVSKLHLTASGEIPEADISTGYPTSELSGPITNSQLAGSISNDKLAPASGTASISGSGTGQGSLFNVIKAASIGTTDIDSTLTADNLAADSVGNSELYIMTSIGSATLASGLAELAVTDVKTSETSSYVKAAYRYCSTPDKSDLNYETATVASDGGSIVSDGSTSQSCSTDIVVYIIETAYTSTGLSAVISPPSYGTTCNSVASVCKTASNSGSYYCSDGDSESVLTVYCSAETSFNYAITGTTVSTVNTLTASV